MGEIKARKDRHPLLGDVILMMTVTGTVEWNEVLEIPEMVEIERATAVTVESERPFRLTGIVR